MRHFHQYADLEPLITTQPDLWRELYGYMAVCLYEDDEADLQFLVATEEDIPTIQALGTPEETATIIIRSQDQSRTIHRIIYVTEVIFLIDTEHLPTL